MAMAFCYDKLRGKITEKFKTRERFAEAMGLSGATISAKLNNKSEWTQDEVILAVKVLELSCDDIPAYFFACEV